MGMCDSLGDYSEVLLSGLIVEREVSSNMRYMGK